MQFSITSLQVVMPSLQGLMNIQKHLFCCMVQQIPYTKIRPLQRGVRTVQTIPYKLKFNTKIRRYQAMPFMVMRFNERILQIHFWNCVRPYDGSFSKTGEIDLCRISDSKGGNIFQNTPFKDIRILTLLAPISQNGLTHSNNSSAICRRIV